ncbi:MAG: sigma-E processing peptidase SpoIIGA [Alkaliphilus sp.]|nr:MAG: sigma-E processing peptidase SpoIIGA [Alkaliphilus sp.]
MIIYAEYVFIENFIMNFIILSLTAKLGKAKFKTGQLIIASTIGTMYSFIIFFPTLYFLFTTLMKISFSILLIVIAFSPYKFKEFFKLLVTFYLITFVFGGAGFAIFYLTNFSGIIGNGIFYIVDLSAKQVYLSCGLAYILIHISWNFIQRQIVKERIFMKVKIEMEGKKISFNGMVDTGNSLTDPITKYPVIIVEYDTLVDLFPDDIINAFENSKPLDFEKIIAVLSGTTWLKRFRVIPFESIGIEKGMLVGFRPDFVVVEKETKTSNIKNVIIAMYSKKLSTTGEYSALLHPDIMFYEKL